MEEIDKDKSVNNFEEVDLEGWIKYFDCEDKKWNIAKRYVDPRRSNRLVQKFNQNEKDHPIWTEHLVSGLPTFYGLLCVSEDAPVEAIKAAYEKKSKYSIHAKELIDEAYNTLVDQELKMEYDSIVQLFGRVSQVFNPKEKKEMVIKHDAWLLEEKNHAIVLYFDKKHKGWVNLFLRATPTFYELLGVKNDDSIKDIEQAHEGKESLEIIEEVYRVLSDEKLKYDYDFMLNFYREQFGDNLSTWISKKKGFWDSLEETGELMLTLLKDTDRVDKADGIIAMKGEWKAHLPPGETFYDLLSIGIDDLPEHDEEIEKTLMEKFLGLEGNPKVKIAYDTLRDSEMRKEYNWAMENSDLIKKLSDLEDY